MTAQLAGGVQASADDERAGARDHLDSISSLVEELVGLNLGILKTLRDVPVRWKHRDGKARECSRQHSVTIGEQRLVLWCIRRVARRNGSCVGTCRNLRHERRGQGWRECKREQQRPTGTKSEPSHWSLVVRASQVQTGRCVNAGIAREGRERTSCIGPVACLCASHPSENQTLPMISHLGRLISDYGYLIVALFIFGEGIAIPFPTDTTLITAAALAAHGRLSVMMIFLVSTVSTTLGTSVAFVLGRRGGDFFDKHSRRVSPVVIARTRGFFDRHRTTAVLIGRFVPCRSKKPRVRAST